jgi:predicted phage tail protein
VQAGATLAELLAEAEPNPRFHSFAHIAVNGATIDREHWRAVRPKPGTLVTIRMVPAGGGGGSGDILRIVLMIAILAFAVAAPYLFPATAFVLAGSAVSVGTLVGLGVSVVGAPCRNLLISRVPPT